MGDLEAALDPTAQGVRRAVTAYRAAEDYRELFFSGTGIRNAPGIALLHMVGLLADAGEREQLVLECRALRQRFRSYYGRFPPAACEEAAK